MESVCLGSYHSSSLSYPQLCRGDTLAPSTRLGKRIIVVKPAYNAEKTLEQTYREIPDEIDEVILVDDLSRDNTVEVAHKLGLDHVIRHEENKGYGGNQKTCYNKAIELNADVVSWK